jgi:uncharacterized protein
MEDKDFAWDDDKAARNWRDHASSFEMAREAFRDPFAIEWEDTAQGRNEERHSLIGMVENRLLFVGYTIWDGKIRIITARKAEPYERRRRMKKTDKHDWSRFDALTDAEAHAAALADPDAQPLTEERLAHMKRVPRARTLRRALGLTQEEFATRYPHPDRHASRLGAGPVGARPAGPGLSQGDRDRSRWRPPCPRGKARLSGD